MYPIQLQNQSDVPAPPMPMLPFIQRQLAQKHGAQKVNIMAARLQANYDALYARRPVFMNKGLRNHVEAKILPGLALYQTFLADGMSRAAALNETEQVLTALTNQRMTRWMKLLSHLPGTFWLLRRLTERVMRTQYVRPGFEFHWVENSPRQIAFTMTRCLYHNTLMAYGASELTQVFCRMDDVWGAALAPKVIFERPHTIGRGDSECDFCYRRSKPELEVRVGSLYG
jgi:L-2-amino-thiazoline-4-carboxylic acid hydrolase